MSARRPLRERFDEKWTPEPFSGCWLWTAALDTIGYGQIVGDNAGELEMAHRAGWQLYRGQIPDGLHVLHRCDTRQCVNPNHLFLGTHQDNMRDRNDKGRARGARGEIHGMSKLNRALVMEIRQSTEKAITLARRMGVGKTTIEKVRRRETWKHVHASAR